MVTHDHIAIIDDLLVLPFPVASMDSVQRSSGPGFHVQILQASQDFWDDRSDEVVEPAQAEIDDAFQTLATVLTARWGEPRVVDLYPYVWSEVPAPEPINQLCQLSGEICIWQPVDDRRWVGLAVGQADPEFPIQLLAAVGEPDALR